MAEPIYLLTQCGLTYKGKAKYQRYFTNKGLTRDQVKTIFENLYKQFGCSLLGVYYHPDSGLLMVWVKEPVMSYMPWLFLVPLAVVGGVILYFAFKGSGSGEWNPTNPPGLSSISFIDLIKVGLIVLIAGAVVYIGVNAYASIKRAEKMAPEEIVPLEYIRREFIEPTARYTGKALQYVGKGAKYLIERYA